MVDLHRYMHLVGGIPTPMKNMSSSVGMMIIPNMESHKIHVPNHQPDIYNIEIELVVGIYRIYLWLLQQEKSKQNSYRNRIPHHPHPKQRLSLAVPCCITLSQLPNNRFYSSPIIQWCAYIYIYIFPETYIKTKCLIKQITHYQYLF